MFEGVHINVSNDTMVPTIGYQGRSENGVMVPTQDHPSNENTDTPPREFVSVGWSPNKEWLRHKIGIPRIELWAATPLSFR